MNKKMTAVEWLAKEICYINDDGKYIVDDAEDVTHIVQKAKEIEKEELKDFYFGGCSEMYATEKGFENYYYETYKPKQI